MVPNPNPDPDLSPNPNPNPYPDLSLSPNPNHNPDPNPNPDPAGTAEKAAAVDEARREVGDSLYKFVGQHETPVHRVEEAVAGGASALAVTVQLPRIQSMAQLHLDVTSRVVQVSPG